jgi:hypothetical protein
MTTCILLGPQRPTINLGGAFDLLDGDRPVAVVSAGWQEVEEDIEHVRKVVPRSLVNLRLYGRAEEVFGRETRLQEIYRERQDRLMELQRLHRYRLNSSMLATRRLLLEDNDTLMLRHEQRHAFSQQRALDKHHLQRIGALHEDYEARIAEQVSPLLSEHIQEVAETIAGCDTVLITGGNVAILRNRLRLFRLDSLLASRNIVAWSAGAMVLADKVVLYHDNTPEGRRNAEVFDQGLGILGNVVLLPDAKHRLNAADRTRVALFCRRFAPAACLTLDSGSMLRFDDGRLSAATGVRQLSRNGTLRKVRIR